MSAGQQFGAVLTAGVLCMVLIGPLVSQREVPTQPKAAGVILSNVITGYAPQLALATFDEWLNTLERNEVILSQTDLESGFKRMENLARDCGVAEQDIQKRLARFKKFKYSRKA